MESGVDVICGITIGLTNFSIVDRWRFIHLSIWVNRRASNIGKKGLGRSWSPDGTEITYVSGKYGKLEIYVMNAERTNQTNITIEDTGWDFNPSWSPVNDGGDGFIFHVQR